MYLLSYGHLEFCCLLVFAATDLTRFNFDFWIIQTENCTKYGDGASVERRPALLLRAPLTETLPEALAEAIRWPIESVAIASSGSSTRRRSIRRNRRSLKWSTALVNSGSRDPRPANRRSHRPSHWLRRRAARSTTNPPRRMRSSLSANFACSPTNLKNATNESESFFFNWKFCSKCSFIWTMLIQLNILYLARIPRPMQLSKMADKIHGSEKKMCDRKISSTSPLTCSFAYCNQLNPIGRTRFAAQI